MNVTTDCYRTPDRLHIGLLHEDFTSLMSAQALAAAQKGKATLLDKASDQGIVRQHADQRHLKGANDT